MIGLIALRVPIAQGWFRRRGLTVVATVLLVTLTGCSLSRPPFRPGSLPYPGALTLYAEADPNDLGEHRTDAVIFAAAQEVERGIVYTRRCGFLDIAHLRLAVDWTRRFARDLKPDLVEARSLIKLSGSEPTDYRIRMQYPPGYETWPEAQRDAAAERWAIELAGVMGWTAMTWHEFATYYGYKSLVIIPEDRSAFSYDDGVAHLIGVALAQDAMREVGTDDTDGFNEAVTRGLDRAMSEYEAVPPETMREAIAAVKGSWWGGDTPLLRHLDMGWQTGKVTPWLVPGFRSSSGPVIFTTPGFTFDSGDGAVARIAIDPNIFESGSIRAAINHEGGHLHPEKDFGPLAAAIAEELGQDITEVRAAQGKHESEPVSRTASR